MAEGLSQDDLDGLMRQAQFSHQVADSTYSLRVDDRRGCLFLVIFGQPLARVWVGEDLVPPMSLLVVMGLWTFYGMVMNQCSFLMNAAQVVRPQVFMATSMAVCNIVLSIFLTREFGLIGPVVGSLVSHALCAGVPTVIIVRRLLAQRSAPVVGA